jgi:hypothetical protein
VLASAGLITQVRARPEPGVGVRRYSCRQERIQECQILFGTLGTLEFRRGGFQRENGPEIKSAKPKKLAHLIGILAWVVTGFRTELVHGGNGGFFKLLN